MGELEEAEALLLAAAAKADSHLVINRLERAARSLFWSESTGRPPIDDTAALGAIASMIEGGARLPIAIRTVGAQLAATEADKKRWRRKLPKNVFGQ